MSLRSCNLVRGWPNSPLWIKFKNCPSYTSDMTPMLNWSHESLRCSIIFLIVVIHKGLPFSAYAIGKWHGIPGVGICWLSVPTKGNTVASSWLIWWASLMHCIALWHTSWNSSFWKFDESLDGTFLSTIMFMDWIYLVQISSLLYHEL